MKHHIRLLGISAVWTASMVLAVAALHRYEENEEAS